MLDTDIVLLDRCTGRQLRRLLALASSDSKVAKNSLLEIGDLEQLELLLTDMCAGAGQSAGALLQSVYSSQTPLEFLVSVKSTAKRLAVAAATPAQKAAATLLYHLSVAGALGRYGQNISSKNPAGRLTLYKELATELVDEQLAAIFEKAVARLAS